MTESRSNVVIRRAKLDREGGIEVTIAKIARYIREKAEECKNGNFGCRVDLTINFTHGGGIGSIDRAVKDKLM